LQDSHQPIEGDCWQVTLHGMVNNYPPISQAAFWILPETC
jgi:hypothetical protein